MKDRFAKPKQRHNEIYSIEEEDGTLHMAGSLWIALDHIRTVSNSSISKMTILPIAYETYVVKTNKKKLYCIRRCR